MAISGTYPENDYPEDDDTGVEIDIPDLTEAEIELIKDITFFLRLLDNSDVAHLVGGFIRKGMARGDKLPPSLDLFGYILPAVFDLKNIEATEEPIFRDPNIEFINLYRLSLLHKGESTLYPRLEIQKEIGHNSAREDGLGMWVSDINFSIAISKEIFPSSGDSGPLSSFILSFGSEDTEIDIAFSERLPGSHYIVSLSRYKSKGETDDVYGSDEMDDELILVDQLALFIDGNGHLLNVISAKVRKNTSELWLN